MQQVLLKNIEEVKNVCRQHKVKKLYAFGSVCTNAFSNKSDIDFIVAFESRYFDGYVDNFLSLEKELKRILKLNVDIVAEETLENPYFIKVVNRTKTPIYE
ncbi:MAG: nucleotidyltransferase domain-containing protein [Bacteroidetes bacterium]|nr:nucleotidyltransferase domain-containing protein [Bacteroidota bacterium]